MTFVLILCFIVCVTGYALPLRSLSIGRKSSLSKLTMKGGQTATDASKPTLVYFDARYLLSLKYKSVTYAYYSFHVDIEGLVRWYVSFSKLAMPSSMTFGSAQKWQMVRTITYYNYQFDLIV